MTKNCHSTSPYLSQGISKHFLGQTFIVEGPPEIEKETKVLNVNNSGKWKIKSEKKNQKDEK